MKAFNETNLLFNFLRLWAQIVKDISDVEVLKLLFYFISLTSWREI